MRLDKLHEAIAAVAPIETVTVYDPPEDKSRWRIVFKPGATEGQKIAAAEVAKSFNPAVLKAAPTRDERIATMLSAHDLTLADLKAALAK